MTNYEKLIATLKEVFMLDKAELDFGIYRIMNQKRKDIEQFLEKDLVPQVKQVLAENLSVDKQALQKDLEEAIKQLKDLGVDPDTAPKVQQLKARLGEAADMDGLENEVFSLLANFFKRYFDNGDFISMRRYKKDVYAIPYEGEEVKLHWANADQYYIKTSEYFKNYRFKLSNGKTVSFELMEASTEQNNNKAQGDKERRFAIYSDVPFEQKDGEFKIYFTYEPADKKVKQSDLLQTVFNTIKEKIPADFLELLSLKPTEKDKQRTLLQKHLLDYTARNTFDYFIHKDLGRFLTRELDFYIKNEVLFIDDLNTRDEQEFLKQLSKIKAVKKIGEKVIAFLAQLENFQKKLWLKKKFVLDTNYCVTIDRIPKELYSIIANNDQQINEWIKLFAIDKIKGSVISNMFDKPVVGFSQPLDAAFLEQNQHLVLDTIFFDEQFKNTLLLNLGNIDKELDGLLVHSENFQALRLLQQRYQEQIKCIYIDPPYNTAASEILYKNSFKHASWLALIENRVSISKSFLRDDGILCFTIDDFENNRAGLLLDNIFSENNNLGVIAIRNNPSGRSTPKGVSVAHEYALIYGKTENSKVGRLKRSQKQIDRYDEKDDDSVFEWVNFRKHGGTREEAKSMFYPIFISESSYRIPEMEWNEEEEVWVLLEQPKINEQVLYPIDENKIERRWKWGLDRLKDNPSDAMVDKDKNGELALYVKARMNNEGVLPLTFWDDKKYSSTSHGANLLKKLFNRVDLFSYPKSIFAVEDSLRASNVEKQDTILDFFAGSGTTGHAVINLNRDDKAKRKYVLVEMGDYFNNVTKPRVQKAIYSIDWKDGKPIGRDGISHCFKYVRLESYEDTLNNLTLKQSNSQQNVLEINTSFKETYTLNYMLDVEADGGLLNLEWFIDPFNCYLNTTRNNELKPTKVDLVETFNYLIGLVVENYAAPKEGYRIITGKNLNGEKILVVWRDCKKHNSQSLNEFVRKSSYNPLDNEFDRVYVNGDNNLENLKIGDERWKVVLIEEEFKKRMFEN